MEILRGDRIGIVGPNGAGKSTLINLLTEGLEPDSGTVVLGTNLQMVTLDQKRESLNPNWTLKEALTTHSGDMVQVGDSHRHVVGYMKDFLFRPEQARSPISVLSGGERGRLMLARALAKPSNFLVLDEPTNDLDLETLDLLQEVINDYTGTVLLVSHDRDFLDRLCTTTLYAEGDGRWTEYAGGYTDMIAQRGSGVTASKAGRKDKPGKAADAPSDRPSAPKQQKGLTFKDKHLLENPSCQDGRNSGQDRPTARPPRRPGPLHQGPGNLQQGSKGPRGTGRAVGQGRGEVAGAGNPAGRARRELTPLPAAFLMEICPSFAYGPAQIGSLSRLIAPAHRSWR